ncbi:hypothetical protein NKR23_g811 [Pleurostoma richardsiae]|uniref:Uncharacterized protein n=1 Tax=Pleurostoma richardsiae TaxID=41990 RepID=A0AA38RTD5_9PEZI|nr:hypothetical protein NKR23_g811 [Pleurostoma richardsiae]
MSFTAQFHMPGAYHFEAPTSTSTSSALNAGIFRPPISPSASSYNLSKSIGSLYSEDTSVHATPAAFPCRKRNRDQPHSAEGNHDTSGDSALDTASIRYILAGQIDTPNGQPGAESGDMMEESVYSDIDYRRALGSKRAHDTDLESPSSRFANLQIAGTPGAAQTPRSAGWSTLALNTIGGVVGKVWEFCKGGAFTGFYAGGGKGYAINNSTPTSSPPGYGNKPWCSEHDIPSLQNDADNVGITHTPGTFPAADYSMHDLGVFNTPDSTPQPAAKRRQVRENDELRRNWVMVDEPPSQVLSNTKRTSTASSAFSRTPGRPSSRQQPRYTMPTASSGRKISVPVPRLSERPGIVQRRTSLRISHAGSPSLNAREPASFAPPRSPRPRTTSAAPAFTPSRITMPAQQPPTASPNPFARAASPRPPSQQATAAPSLFGSASSKHRRTTSSASAAPTTAAPTATWRNTELGVGDIEASPRLNAEAKQLASRKLAAERDTDARIEAFNVRLRDMIRQGREALGTTVEVQETGVDDDAWDDE